MSLYARIRHFARLRDQKSDLKRCAVALESIQTSLRLLIELEYDVRVGDQSLASAADNSDPRNAPSVTYTDQRTLIEQEREDETTALLTGLDPTYVADLRAQSLDSTSFARELDSLLDFPPPPRSP